MWIIISKVPESFIFFPLLSELIELQALPLEKKAHFGLGVRNSSFSLLQDILHHLRILSGCKSINESERFTLRLDTFPTVNYLLQKKYFSITQFYLNSNRKYLDALGEESKSWKYRYLNSFFNSNIVSHQFYTIFSRNTKLPICIPSTGSLLYFYEIRNRNLY